jgi:TonB family protein
MSAFLNYSVEANVGLLLFLGGCRILLWRETDFRFQRTLLVTGIIASLLFPLMHVQTIQHASVLSIDEMIPSRFLPQTDVSPQFDNSAPEQSFAFWQYIAIIYIIGLVISGVSFLFELGQLFILVYRCEKCRVGKLLIAESTDDKPTFSFFHFIFIGRTDVLSSDEKDQIVRHESVHVTQMHSIDILLVTLLKVLFWFNPIIAAYRRALVEVHEFEADARTVDSADAGRYCNLLAKVALQTNGLSLGCYFNQSLTLKRIAMIRSVKSKTALWKMALSAALFPLAFLLLSCQDQFKNDGQGEGRIFSALDEPAVPKGGMEAFYNTVRTNLRYPAEARSGHSYGKVAVQFVVNEDGRLSDFQLLESPGKILGEEAIRVLSLSPEWIPAKKSGVAVKQSLVLPITFKLNFPGRQKQTAQNRKGDGERVPVALGTVIFTPFSRLGEVVVVGYALK